MPIGDIIHLFTLSCGPLTKTCFRTRSPSYSILQHTTCSLVSVAAANAICFFPSINCLVLFVPTAPFGSCMSTFFCILAFSKTRRGWTRRGQSSQYRRARLTTWWDGDVGNVRSRDENFPSSLSDIDSPTTLVLVSMSTFLMWKYFSPTFHDFGKYLFSIIHTQDSLTDSMDTVPKVRKLSHLINRLSRPYWAVST